VTGAAALVVASTLHLAARGADDRQAPKTEAVLRTQLQLSDSDLSALRQGRAIVKTLPAQMNREMITAGAVRIHGASMPRFIEEFKALEGFRTSQFVKQLQKFSDPPRLSDLDSLTVEPEDIDALRGCRVDSCDVQLAAADIERFAREIDWRAPDAARRAAALYKSVLFGYLTSYRGGGRDRLVHYRDREDGVQLSAEIAALQDASPSVLDLAPAFHTYLRQYPAADARGTESFFYWSKEAFGFKPVVGLNHVALHTDEASGRVLIVTTQIYASHYIQGTVAINLLMPDQAAGQEPGFYWLYLNRSRVGRLGGLLGAISRPIVQRRARSGLTKSLTQTKQRFEAGRR